MVIDLQFYVYSTYIEAFEETVVYIEEIKNLLYCKLTYILLY